MALYRYPSQGNGFTKDQNGRTIVGVTITCYLAGTNTATNIYKTAAGGTPVYSITSSTVDGSYAFWMSDADYPVTQLFDVTHTLTGYATVTNSSIAMILGNTLATPTTSTVGDIVIWNDTVGRTIADSGVKITTDGTLVGNVDTLIPTEKAVKTYADTKVTGSYASAAEIVTGAVSAKAIAPDQLALAKNVGTGNLKTSTGVATAVSSVGYLNIITNDYSFFPWFSIGPTWDGYPIWLRPLNMADSGSYPNEGMIQAVWTAGASGSCTVRWRYITASDDPTLWVIYGAQGKLLSVWLSDDAPSSGNCPIDVGQGTKVKIDVNTLVSLGLSDANYAAADAWIAAKGYSPAHRVYRAFQQMTGQDAPGAWLMEHTQFVDGQLVQITDEQAAILQAQQAAAARQAVIGINNSAVIPQIQNSILMRKLKRMVK